jgi:alkylation response protein AidB-like acyl-CoA dehydrogenase
MVSDEGQDGGAATGNGPDLEAFRATMRGGLADNLRRRDPADKPRARGMDHRTVDDIAVQRAVQRSLFDAGYAGLAWPVEYGGRGLGMAYQRAFDEEAAGYMLPDLGIAGIVTMAVCAKVMLAHASEAFKRRHLPRILRGDELWVELFSEPGAGSDLAAVTSTAVREGDGWVLNGHKIWTSGAYYADYGMCLARTDWGVPKHRGLTWFAVPIGAPGVTVKPLREITGDIEFCEEMIDDVVVPDAERIGEVNDGWSVAQTALLYEREASSGSLTSETGASGPGPLAPDLVNLARRVGRHQDRHVRQLIARAHINDYALRQLGARAGRLMAEAGPAGAAYVGYPKLAAGMVEPARARIAMEIGRGCAITWPPGDHDGITTGLGYLNSRVKSIAGGSNEIQRNGLGERVLGLPREPSFDSGKPFREVMRDPERRGPQ